MPLGVDCIGWASAKHTFGVPEAAKADHSLYFSRSVGLSAQADVQLKAVMIEAARTARRISPSRFVVSGWKHTYLIFPWPGDGVTPPVSAAAGRLAHARPSPRAPRRRRPGGWRTGRGSEAGRT